MACLQRLAVAALSVALFGGCERTETTQTGGEQAAEHGEPDVDEGQIVEKLEQADLGKQSRLSAIHTARERGIEDAREPLRELLDADDPEVVVAAAAALHGLETPDITSDIVDAAGRLSRHRHYEQLRQLLFIIGDVGGPTARTYLDTVAEGHEVPPIRQTASQVLDRMNGASP